MRPDCSENTAGIPSREDLVARCNELEARLTQAYENQWWQLARAMKAEAALILAADEFEERVRQCPRRRAGRRSYKRAAAHLRRLALSTQPEQETGGEAQ